VGEATIGFSDFEAFGFDEGLVDDAAVGSTLGTSNEGFWINKPALFSISGQLWTLMISVNTHNGSST